jgi:hypothetical protein
MSNHFHRVVLWALAMILVGRFERRHISAAFSDSSPPVVASAPRVFARAWPAKTAFHVRIVELLTLIQSKQFMNAVSLNLNFSLFGQLALVQWAGLLPIWLR